MVKQCNIKVVPCTHPLFWMDEHRYPIYAILSLMPLGVWSQMSHKWRHTYQGKKTIFTADMQGFPGNYTHYSTCCSFDIHVCIHYTAFLLTYTGSPALKHIHVTVQKTSCNERKGTQSVNSRSTMTPVQYIKDITLNPFKTFHLKTFIYEDNSLRMRSKVEFLHASSRYTQRLLNTMNGLRS